MEISTLYQIFLNCSTVTTDSRNCDSFNGNAFAAQALNDGCAYAVIDETGHNPKDNERYILVDNCLETLQQLANYHRRQLGTRIIGITGTNGKTTTFCSDISFLFKTLDHKGKTCIPIIKTT